MSADALYHEELLMTRITTAIALVALPTSAFAFNWGQTTDMAERTSFDSTMDTLDLADTEIRAFAVDPAGEWLIVDEDSNMHYSAGFSSDILYATLLTLWYGDVDDIEALDCNEAGTCLLVHSAGYTADGPLPSGLTTRINSMHASGWAVRDVEFTATAWVLLGPGTVVYYDTDADVDLRNALYDRHRAGRTVEYVDIGFDGRWLVVADNNPMSEGLSDAQAVWMDNAAEAGWNIDDVELGVDDDWFMYDQSDTWHAPDLTDPSEAVEYELGPYDETIWERMEDYGVPGVAIAIIEDNEVVSARGYGTRAFGEQMPVLGNTPFDIASLTKYLSALTTVQALRKEPETWGYDLDDDVLDIVSPGGNVDTWMTRGEDDPTSYGFDEGLPELQSGMTFRRLLSHTGAMRTGGSGPPTLGVFDSEAGAASTADWMSGYECTDVDGCGYLTDDNYAWQSATLGDPGDQWGYSNGGFLLAQATLEDHAGQSGGSLMAEYLFDPMGLVDITAEYPVPRSIKLRMAYPHDKTEQDDHQYFPWTFSGGVVSSVEDYAELVILGLNEGVSSDGVEIVEADDIAEILSPNTLNSGTLVAYGLGVSFDNVSGAGEGDGEVFFHDGHHSGLAATYFCGSTDNDDGIVIFFNSDDSSGDSEITFRNEILAAYTASKGWTENCR